MNNFILNLALRGAGHQPVMIQSATTPALAHDLRSGRPIQSEFAQSEAVEREPSRPAEVISTQPSTIQKQPPLHTIEPSSQAQTHTATPHRQESQFFKPTAPELKTAPATQGPKAETPAAKPKAEAIPLIQRIVSSAPSQSHLPAQETPSISVAGLKDRAESTRRAVTARATPQAEESFKQTSPGKQPPGSVVDVIPSTQTSDAATAGRMPGSSHKTDRSEPSPVFLIESETMAVAVPAAIQPLLPRHTSIS